MTGDFDVVVLGAGLAGLSAAVTAATGGARTLVLERAPVIGGSAAISGGYVWAIEDEAALRREDPGPYQRHGLLVVEGYHDAIAWLSDFAPPLTGVERALAGRGRKFDMPVLLAHLTRALTAAGGQVVVGAQTENLARDSGGYLVEATTPAGPRRITARSVVLATGGRQADPDVRAGLVGGGFVPPLRGNPWSRGAGVALAAGLGASVNTANTGFYGHLFAEGAEPLSPIDYIAFALYHSSHGVLLDPAGHRFTDETRGDHNNAMALAAHGGRGLLLWSEAVQRAAAETPFIPGSPRLDRWAFSRDRGGHVGVADNVDALPVSLDAEARARLGDGRVFHADVVPAITFTFGGIEADTGGTALDTTGTPIDGLYPAGADLSDVYNEGYGGGLCLAVVSGRRAGQLAAARTGKEAQRV
ncbi:FAD-binding protein [Amycolatopsis balhimycina DSM 5908]|uniref:FAD-binding protein n=1 Tax=Amycolatopsis balhimycina DSM 5908 TaxID=1081091 RepID=A0A428W3X2_AMYBA|nr:FAD-binding protein [Amycolatopsis balhimycina]RSM37778.1 FAD-binding protein [Amycolatopsis balhimycina DSM 5908]